MANNSVVTESTQSYNSMAGADIKAVFGSIPFGELQAISYAVTREKAPIYTMGSPDPRSYSRNKRGIAGSFVWINFDRHALLENFQKAGVFFLADIDDLRPAYVAASTGNLDSVLTTSQLSNVRPGSTIEFAESPIDSVWGDQEAASPWYSDQIPPFDIILAANNEYGASAQMKLVGVEILNDGMGVSIDDTVIESQSTFVCRTVLPWTAVANPFRRDDGTVGPAS
jgi:hypothetical protein